MRTPPDMRAALSRIEELNKALGRDPELDPILAAARASAAPSRPDHLPSSGDPVGAAAANMIAYLKERIEKIRLERIRAQERLADIEGDTRSQEVLRDYMLELEEKIPSYDAHESALLEKIGKLQHEPVSMFLPLGTIVRFTDADLYSDSLSIFGDLSGKDYPQAGTIGVVTGHNHEREWPIRVSVRRPFKDGYGTDIRPHGAWLPTYFVDPEKIEVISPGMFPGGRPCESYSYVPTHQRVGSSLRGDRDDEMIIEADGFFWRFHDFGGTQGIEALQAYEAIEEMSWVGDPLPAMERPAEAEATTIRP